jgi:hypothetical protein
MRSTKHEHALSICKQQITRPSSFIQFISFYISSIVSVTMRYSRLFVTSFTLQLASSVCAWGAIGHDTVALIAQNFVSANTTAFAQKILSDTSSTYLQSVANWADSYRATAAGKFSAPFHFIDAEDNPPHTCNVDYQRDCGAAGCVVSAITNYVRASIPTVPSLCLLICVFCRRQEFKPSLFLLLRNNKP